MESRESFDIKDHCALCKSLPCCPEHCCNWDACTCKDCEYCQPSTKNEQMQSDPTIFIKATGSEEITKVRKQKAQAKGDMDKQKKEVVRPSEQIRAGDGALIINYEVPQEEDEKLSYAGGIKGIRALRHQRDALNEHIQEELVDHKHKFSKYEEESKR